MSDKGERGARGVPGGMSRRNFIKFCSVMAAGMGLPLSMGARIAEAITSPRRPSVIWLSGQECTGCTETLLRADHPDLAKLILDLISLDYSETLNTGSGHQAEEFRQRMIAENEGRFILVCEGSIPVKDGGIYCKVAGRPVLDILRETAPKAAAVIAIGSCSSWGGVPAAGPNPTGATPVHQIITDKPVVNIPGCPPNPYNFLSTVLYFATFKKLPKLDKKGRPVFAYGRLIHENCERRPHFDAGRFAEKFGDEGHRQGWCLYKLGCKGPETFNNCSTLRFNDVGVWPVNIGHPCFGCVEEGIGFNKPLHALSEVVNVTPAASQAPVDSGPKGKGMSAGSAALAGGAAGIAIGASAMAAKKLCRADQAGCRDNSDGE